MIEKEGIYYLYMHIRKDTNLPMYIGVGTKSKKVSKSFKTEYLRAFETKTRSKIWKAIAEKTEFEVVILLETNDKSFLEEKEIEFIALYGRRVLNNGSLANLHRGGNYKIGHNLSQEQKNRISERQTGSKNLNAIKLYDKDSCKIYNSISEVSILFNIDSKSLVNMMKGLAKNTTNIMFYNDFLIENYRAFSFVDGTKTQVIDYITKQEFKSIIEAADFLGMKVSKLTDYLRGTKCSNPTNLIKLKHYNLGLTPSTVYRGKIKKQQVYDLEKEIFYNSVEEASNITGLSINSLYHKLGGSSINDTKLIYKTHFDNGLMPENFKVDKKKKRVLNMDTLKEYGSIKEAAIDNGISQRALSKYLIKGIKGKLNLSYAP